MIYQKMNETSWYLALPTTGTENNTKPNNLNENSLDVLVRIYFEIATEIKNTKLTFKLRTNFFFNLLLVVGYKFCFQHFRRKSSSTWVFSVYVQLVADRNYSPDIHETHRIAAFFVRQAARYNNRVPHILWRYILPFFSLWRWFAV